MRFHLSFDYDGGKRWGDQVVVASSIEQAVGQIMRERKLTQIHIRKRYSFGQPASEAEIIDKNFKIDIDSNSIIEYI